MIQSFVNNPVKVAVGVILIALFGGIALYKMPMELTPDVEIPTLTIETRWVGASPQEIEKEIVQEQEEQLQSVEGLQKMTSESMDSMGRITLEFAVDADMSKALLMVNTRLQQVREYPEDADEPVIMTSNADKFIAWFILNLRPPSDDDIDAFAQKHPELAEPLQRVRVPNPSLRLFRVRELAEKHPAVAELVPKYQDLTLMQRFADDFIAARFERVEGVSNSNVVGSREDEMQVIVDPELLARSGLTIETVRQALMAQNEDIAAGDLWEGKKRIVVRTLGQFRSPEQVEAALLTRVDGRPIHVRDVARVEHGFKKADQVVRRYGQPVIAINVQRETGANVLEVMKGLREAKDQLNAALLHTRGLEITQVYDETDYIYSSMNVVTENVLEGAVLSFIVLILFLKNIRSSLVIFMAIATSMIGMFLLLGALGRSLNLLSLAGIAFAVGMLVDNFIVVLENIFRHRQEGDSLMGAVVSGTGEVWGAVIASTLANLAVFVPVLFVHDQVGQLFHDLALSIACALAISLLVSLILIPTAASRLLVGSKAHDADGPLGDEHNWLHRLCKPFDRFGAAFRQAVVGANAFLQKSFVLRLTTVFGCLAFSLYFSWLLMPKVEYLPNGNRNLAIGIMLPPPGYNLDQLNAIGQKIEEKMRKYWDNDGENFIPVERMVPVIGRDGNPVMENDKPKMELREVQAPAISDFFYVLRGRQLFLGLKANDPLRAGELVGAVREATSDVPGMIVVAKQTSLFESGLGGGRTVDIEITGPDVRTLVGLARRVMGQVMGSPEKPGVIPGGIPFPKPSADLSSPELHVVPKWHQAADLGITAAELGYAVNALVDGAYAGDYNFAGDKIDLSIVGESTKTATSQDVRGLSMFTPEGQAVTLETVAEVIPASGPEQINRRERLRAITVSVTPPPEMPIEEAMERIQAQIVESIENDPQYAGVYDVSLSGTADKLRTTWLSIRWNLLLAVIITYLVIAALFESWVYPFIIMLSVPLGGVGGIIGLWLLNMSGVLQPLDMFTMVGFIILVGTVVNNPILIIEQALVHMRDDGMPPRQAILESVESRIRPIFMTALIGLLGLLPLVISPGAGSELYRGLGSVTLGGLVFSTFFTLFFIPALFSLCLDAQAGIAGLFGGKLRTVTAGAETSAPVHEEPQLETSGASPTASSHAHANGTNGRDERSDGNDANGAEAKHSESNGAATHGNGSKGAGYGASHESPLDSI